MSTKRLSHIKVAELLRKSASLIETLQLNADHRAASDTVNQIASDMVSKGLIEDSQKSAKIKELKKAEDLNIYKKALELLPGEPDRLSEVTKKAHHAGNPLDEWIFS